MKDSLVWEVFKVDSKDSTKAICSVCSDKLSRGKDPRNQGTSNLRRHLQNKHKEKWKELEEKHEQSAGNKGG